MSERTIVIKVCDRCKSEHNRDDYMKGGSWGQTDVSWSGDRGGRSWQGDAGGTTHKGKAWLCQTCTDAFLQFMETRA
jgi:hypothetical protein